MAAKRKKIAAPDLTGVRTLPSATEWPSDPPVETIEQKLSRKAAGADRAARPAKSLGQMSDEERDRALFKE